MPKLTTLSPDATLTDVRSAIVDAGRVMLELRAKPADQRGDTFAADLRQAAEYITDHDLIAKALEIGEAAERAAADEARNKGRGSRAAGVDLDNERRSMGEQVIDSEQFEDFARRNGRPIEVRNLLTEYSTGAYSSTGQPWLPVGSPQLSVGSIQRRRLYVRDLMSVQGTGLKVIPYVREQNQTTNETGAAFTSEASAKTEVTMTFENYSAIVEKISAWIPISDEAVADAPTLRGYIDTRLTYMMGIREEAGVLSGTGTSPQILGLDNVPGIQTQSAVTGDLPATVGQAIGKVENVDGSANGVVANPLDYWVAVTKRYANQFDNGFSTGAPATAETNITWGLPAVRTRGVASGTGYVADWAMGATLFDRQETTIKVTDSHSDYFTRNLLVIVAEKRVGVAWHRPNLFVKCTMPTT
jgi:HK97 family phage major capsid protein